MRVRVGRQIKKTSIDHRSLFYLPDFIKATFSIAVEIFDNIQKFFKTVEIFRRIIIDINSALFIVADQRNFRPKHRPHPFDQRFQFRAFSRLHRVLFPLQYFGRN